MSVAASCCKLAPVTSDYVPQGNTIKIGDLDVYETQDKTSKTVIVCFYDIFGFHPVTQQVADRLASTGYRVVMPDFFRGQPFPLENFPPKDFSELKNFLADRGSWEKTVKTDLLAVLQHYKEKEGATAFGVYGHCWGTRITTDALVEIPDFQAGGFLHPSFWKIEDASLVKKPLIIMPSKDEDDLIPFYETLVASIGADNVVHHRFDDMHHGFAAARGDLTNELNRKRVDEALNLLENFFHKHIKA